MAPCSAMASSLRNPSGVGVQPEATGFMAATRLPAAANARHNAVAIRVLPTPVSVPVMKSLGTLPAPRSQLAFEVVQRHVGGRSEGSGLRSHRRPRLTEYHFVRCRKSAVDAIGLIGGTHCGKFARAGEPLGPADRSVTRTDGLEIRRQPAHVGIGQDIALDIEYRGCEARAHQRIPDVMHVDELAHP